jgi:hypothetical protein
LQAPSPLTPGQDDKGPSIHPDAGSLEQLQPLPEEPDEVFIKSARNRTLTGISDDVNSLSLTGNESSSYLGISSVMAALRVILWLNPGCQSFVNRSWQQQPDRSHSYSPSVPEPPSSTTPTGEPRPSVWDEPSLVDAYFEYIHPSAPLLAEQTFRNTYLAKSRTDARWQLLLNTVLATGAIASSASPDSGTHEFYFSLAREHLTVETLGSAHIETVQALALLSGVYLHHVQEPNLANALMGATLRMATMLGLHRDFSEGLGPAKNAKKTPKASISIEMRRRIWWTTFMLDASIGSTLGRPSMGRTSPAISARQPQEPIGNSTTHLQLTRDAIRFSQISTRLEDSLAASPLMEEGERQALDTAFVDWYHASTVQQVNNDPEASKASNLEGPGFLIMRNTLRWRYRLARILLHRPSLLWWALRAQKFSSSSISSTKRAAIDTCRSVTSELIHDIVSTWTTADLPPSPIAAWHANHLLYQAVMVPLLSLFSERADCNLMAECCEQVEMSIAAFEMMSHWAKTPRRSREVVSRIYEASKRHPTDLETNEQGVEMVFSASTASASASVSGGIGSGGLGTPATLPSSVSSTGHHLHSHQTQQQAALLHAQSQATSHTRPTFIDLPAVNTGQHHPQPHFAQPHLPSSHPQQQNQNPPFLTTPSSGSADMYMDNMLDGLNWSQGWNNNEYPFETPRLGWDYQAMNGWVGGVGANGMLAEGYEYFGGAATPSTTSNSVPTMGFGNVHHGPAPTSHQGQRGSVVGSDMGAGSVCGSVGASDQQDQLANEARVLGHGVDMGGYYH